MKNIQHTLSLENLESRHLLSGFHVSYHAIEKFIAHYTMCEISVQLASNIGIVSPKNPIAKVVLCAGAAATVAYNNYELPQAALIDVGTAVVGTAIVNGLQK